MKKLIALSLVIFALMCAMMTVASAAVVYDEYNDTYYSTSVSDGVITLVPSEDLDCEKVFDDLLQLNNVVPTVEDLSLSAVESTSTDLNRKTYYYTPEAPFFVFMISSPNSSSDSLYDVQIADSSSNNLFAAAYNVLVNTEFKVPVSKAGDQLKITVTAPNMESSLQLLAGSSSSKFAQDAPEIDETAMIQPFADNTVPKNIDGYQGKVMDRHTMSRGLNLKTNFVSYDSWLTEVNIAYWTGSINWALQMNWPTNTRYYMPGIRIPAGTEVAVKMSTNATPGSITLSFEECVY